MSNFDCEVLIVGAGPAGMAAALAAAESGGQVRMIDDNPHPGGQIWRDGPQVALPETANRYRHAIATRKILRYSPAASWWRSVALADWPMKMPKVAA